MGVRDRWSRLREKAMDLAGRGRELAFARVPHLSNMIGYVLNVRIMDSATVLAAKAFTAVVPVLFVVAAFAPAGLKGNMRSSMRHALGLDGPSFQQVNSLLTARESDTGHVYGLIGLVIVIFSATSCSRSLQKLMERCWCLPRANAKQSAWRWVAWLGGLLITLLVASLAGSAGREVGLVLAIPISILFWWWSQRLLLIGRIGWLPLLPGAVLSGVGLSVWLLASRIYVPGAINRNISRYGPLGSVFTVLSWLVAVTAIVTVSLAGGYLIAQWTPLDRLTSRRKN